ncbi:hypothetical protein GGX14DRAFT_439752 [Mycena pura]|uniref:Uncharacterized protein n=1 Tax=Mycena pura TaxID=153505 RepID=A0AAD6YF83_9AGAR|nr:hypothetical protein GGX14DRAFT_439752 [Mycena pura]
MATESTVRIVPGAPPPKELSKAARKKRKTKPKAEPSTSDVLESSSASLIEKAPTVADIQEGAVAPELVAQPEPEALPVAEEESGLKSSPIVELIHKRLKATTKKITRISTYATTDADKLNDDQRATLKTLPGLEAVQKELAEVKKAVETHEAQFAAELTQRRHEAEKNEKARIASAVAATESVALTKALDLVNFLRLRSLLSSGELSLGLENAEVTAVFSAADALLAEPGETKQAVLTGFMFGQGSHEGISYARLAEITHLSLNPPAPTQEHIVEAVEASGDSETSAVDQPLGVSTAGSFDFMQASELEPSFEDNAEWVERPEVSHRQETPTVEPVNGHIPSEEPAAPVAVDETSNAAINWADEDEGGLPPIAGLHAKFGTSGSATPVVADEFQTDAAAAEPASAPAEEDGFTQARGRGRARGGFRGGERGGERGGYRGGFRGGDRGFRGGAERGRGGA